MSHEKLHDPVKMRARLRVTGETCNRIERRTNFHHCDFEENWSTTRSSLALMSIISCWRSCARTPAETC